MTTEIVASFTKLRDGLIRANQFLFDVERDLDRRDLTISNLKEYNSKLITAINESEAEIARLKRKVGNHVLEAMVASQDHEVHRQRKVIAEEMAKVEGLEGDQAVDARTIKALEKSLSDAAIVQERETVVTGRTIERLEGQITYKDGQIARMTAETLAQEEHIEAQRVVIKVHRKAIKRKNKTIIKLGRKLIAGDK